MESCEKTFTDVVQNGCALEKVTKVVNGSDRMAELRDLVCQLYDIGTVKFGHFKLKSGMDSPVYFDLRVMISHPKLMVLKTFPYILRLLLCLRKSYNYGIM